MIWIGFQIFDNFLIISGLALAPRCPIPPQESFGVAGLLRFISATISYTNFDTTYQKHMILICFPKLVDHFRPGLGPPRVPFHHQEPFGVVGLLRFLSTTIIYIKFDTTYQKHMIWICFSNVWQLFNHFKPGLGLPGSHCTPGAFWSGWLAMFP